MFTFALGNLVSRPLRSSLALAGLIIAIASMTILFAIAEGIDKVVDRTFAQIPGLAIQERGAPIPLFSSLPAEWQQELLAIPGVAVADAEIVQRLNVLDGKTLISPPRFLVGLDVPQRLRLKEDIYRDHLLSGRFLGPEDVGQRRCLISQQISEETGKQAGDSVLLNRNPCEVIGVYNTGSLLLDVNILMDLTALQDMLRLGRDSVSAFYVEAAPGVDKKVLKATIEKHFLGRTPPLRRSDFSFSGILQNIGQTLLAGSPDANPSYPATPATDTKTSPAPDGQPSAVEVRLAEDWNERFTEFTGDLNLFLSLITTMGVTIALLSIVNTMMMSVSERMTEFGILRANGWSKWNVMQLMTLESALLGITGGLIGVVVGWGATHVINALFPDRLQLHAGLRLLVFGGIFSTLLGIVGGLYPAWLAASRSPMEAIRRG
ncbi:ABC transporter permease [Planctomicrobium piriforme]|uniref:Putative ABC transport system permease protein n=1 Tax=Planctomicrobium piriforme TaxID=1576369 RepID=A0A1I3K4I3_9PLAN|nr:ABC transporter permease [Planctomicrobium piriforme]SFI67218.1 putative ABC transport system permease protein [Planctomicrobium piriforme]